MTPSGWTSRIMGPKIQVCCYMGEYPNHDELDNWFVFTKNEAFKSVSKDTDKQLPESFNYRIVDMLNRFKPIFIITKP